MRVLQISSNWGRGGPGGIVKDLYYSLIKDNECVVAYGRDVIPNDVHNYKIGNKLYIYLHIIFSRLFDKSGFASSYATKKLIEYIRNFKPDIIHLHNLLGYYINVELLLNYLQKSDIFVVWTLHDCWPITGHCINFERVNCTQWKRICLKCPLQKEYPESYLFSNVKINFLKKKSALLKLSKLYLVSPSKWLSDIISKSFLNEKPIKIIHNGIDFNVFKPTSSDFKEKYNIHNKIVLLSVAGVWNQMKGEQIIYSLLDYISDEYVIVMIGYKKNKINHKRLINLDRTNDVNELVKWYSLADLFVNPTLGDNFPTVNIEALSCGTPVISFNTGGSKEIYGECGFTVYEKNVNDLYNGIVECLNKNILTSDCVKQAKLFSSKKMCIEYIKLYNSLFERE